MKAKWASVLAALVCLVGSMLACNLPAPTPSPTLSIAKSPEPSVAPSDGTASPESTPTAAVDPTLEPTVDRLLVAYTKSRAIWIVEGESAPRQLTNGSADYSPQFSPDGQWILFQREVPSGEDGLSQNELWIIRVDGTEERRLLGANDLPRETGVGTDEDAVVTTARVPYQIAWLPDGTSIVFNTRLLIEHGLIVIWTTCGWPRSGVEH